MELKRNKRVNAARTLKNFESNLSKAKKELKGMTRARDSAESGLAGAQR